MYLLQALIGSLDCLRLLRLVRVVTLVLVLRHLNENRSVLRNKRKIRLRVVKGGLPASIGNPSCMGIDNS